MYKFNHTQYNKIDSDFVSLKDFSLDSLEGIEANTSFLNLLNSFENRFSFSKTKTFSFSKEGFLALFIELRQNYKDAKIAICESESEALIEAYKIYKELGFEIKLIPLNKDGSVNKNEIKEAEIDFLFISSYVMDTFYITDLKEIKTLTNAKIVSNASAYFSNYSDAVYFDNYKLSGYSLNAVLLFNDSLFLENSLGFIDTISMKICYEAINKQTFNNSLKDVFLEKLIEKFKDDIYFFVDNSKTLPFTLHIALKNIKARELIRTLVFDNIYLSNGEGCSLGLSKPSRVIQAMGYDETTSRNALSFSFKEDLTIEEINKIINKIYTKYLQIKIMN